MITKQYKTKNIVLHNSQFFRAANIYNYDEYWCCESWHPLYRCLGYRKKLNFWTKRKTYSWELEGVDVEKFIIMRFFSGQGVYVIISKGSSIAFSLSYMEHNVPYAITLSRVI